MAVVTMQRQRQRIFLAIFLAVVLIITVVFLVGRRGEEVVLPPAVTPGIPSARTPVPQELFSDDFFINLEPYSLLELPSDIGRDNPFAP